MTHAATDPGKMAVFAFSVACVLIATATLAVAQEREQANEILGASLLTSSTCEATAPAFNPATLPALDSIDAQTDIGIFLQIGVPAPMRLAALRRAWTVDTAIRDFKGLQENHWDFGDWDSIAGFGELGPEVDVEQMVARIFGDPPRLALAGSTSLLRHLP